MYYSLLTGVKHNNKKRIFFEILGVIAVILLILFILNNTIFKVSQEIPEQSITRVITDEQPFSDDSPQTTPSGDGTEQAGPQNDGTTEPNNTGVGGMGGVAVEDQPTDFNTEEDVPRAPDGTPLPVGGMGAGELSDASDMEEGSIGKQ